MLEKKVLKHCYCIILLVLFIKLYKILRMVCDLYNLVKQKLEKMTRIICIQNLLYKDSKTRELLSI